jgi:excisionase family DNA binding protein
MPCTGDSVFPSIPLGKITQKEPAILTTNEEVKQVLQGDIITVGELAEFLQLHSSMQLHSSTIYRLLRRGKLPAFKAGSDWGFSRKAIDRLVQIRNQQ